MKALSFPFGLPQSIKWLGRVSEISHNFLKVQLKSAFRVVRIISMILIAHSNILLCLFIYILSSIYTCIIYLSSTHQPPAFTYPPITPIAYLSSIIHLSVIYAVLCVTTSSLLFSLFCPYDIRRGRNNFALFRETISRRSCTKAEQWPPISLALQLLGILLALERAG